MMKDPELLEALQNLDASLKMQAITSNPNYAIIGPMITELAANRIETLLFEVARLQQEIEEMNNIKLNEVDATKLNLQPGDVLVTTIKSDDITMASMNGLGEQLRGIFPNNKVIVMGVGSEGDIKFTVAKDAASSDTKAAVGCGTTPSAFCGDCSCGKKEAWERGNK